MKCTGIHVQTQLTLWVYCGHRSEGGLLAQGIGAPVLQCKDREELMLLAFE